MVTIWQVKNTRTHAHGWVGLAMRTLTFLNVRWPVVVVGRAPTALPLWNVTSGGLGLARVGGI